LAIGFATHFTLSGKLPEYAAPLALICVGRVSNARSDATAIACDSVALRGRDGMDLIFHACVHRTILPETCLFWLELIRIDECE